MLIPCLLATALTTGAIATAPPPAGPSRSSGPQDVDPSVVVLYVPDQPDSDEDDRLLASIRAHTEQADVDLRILRYTAAATPVGETLDRSRRTAGEYAAGGVMWIRLAPPDGDTHAVLLYDAAGDRLLGRRLPVAPDSRAAALEMLTNVASSVAAESLAGATMLEEIDPTTLEEEAPPSAPEPESEEPKAEPPPAIEPPGPEDDGPAPRRPLPQAPRLHLMLGYLGGTFATATPWHHAVALGAAVGLGRGGFLGLRYDIVIPPTVRTGGIEFDLRRHPISLEGGYRFALPRQTDVAVFGRATVDPIVRRSSAGDPQLLAADDSLRVFSSVAAGVGFGYAPLRPVRLVLRIGAELVTSRAEYVIERATPEVALDPHSARFFAELAVNFRFFWRTTRR